MNIEHADYRIFPAKYAKRQFVVSPTPDGTGYKTRAGRLAEGLGGRYIHRSHGYHLSLARATQFVRLYKEGWDAGSLTGKLIPPRGTYGNPSPV